MSVRKNAINSFKGWDAKKIKEQQGNTDKIISITDTQNAIVLPYTHKDDSVFDDDLVVTAWDKATYLKITTQFDEVVVWISVGTASQQAKNAGFKSLAQVIELSGQPRSTLVDWVDTKPLLFEIILLGCAQKLKLQQDS